MPLTIGIIGMPQTGKSTLFSALTARGVHEQSYEKRKTNLARVEVPNERLWKLSKIFKPKKTTPATVDFVDVGAEFAKEKTQEKATTASLGDKLIADIRTVDLLAQIIRCFPHPYLGSSDPVNELEELELELYLSDLKIIEGRLERSKKMNPGEKELLEELKEKLSRNEPVQLSSINSEQQMWLSGLALLHLKPKIIIGNFAEVPKTGTNNFNLWTLLESVATKRGDIAIPIPAKLEAEIKELSQEEQEAFQNELGIKERGLDQLIQACYKLLGLITFFTVGEDEVKAWTIKQNTRAQEAAGKIHSDLERGFIRAEIISCDEFLKYQSIHTAKEKGAVRIEGKDYLVKDGEIMTVRFNV